MSLTNPEGFAAGPFPNFEGEYPQRHEQKPALNDEFLAASLNVIRQIFGGSSAAALPEGLGLVNVKTMPEPQDISYAVAQTQDTNKPQPENPTPDKQDRLIKQLGSEDIRERAQAQRDLEKLGMNAVPRLEQALNSDDAEVRLRATNALERIASDLNEEVKSDIPGRPFDEAKNSFEKTRSARDLVDVEKLANMDAASAKIRLEQIDQMLPKLERLQQLVPSDSLRSQIDRLKALKQDYDEKNLSARREEANELIERTDHLEFDANCSDAELAMISRCKNLQVLFAKGSRRADEILERAKDCKKLELITLEGSNVTDRGLANLKDSPLEKGLKFLYLGNTNIGDQGLQCLKNVSNLHELNLNNTKITGRGLESLAGMRTLSSLNLDHTNIDGASLQHLSSLKSMERLSLEGTNVHGGLHHLSGLGLSKLYLEKTDVDDEDMKQIQKLEDIKVLTLGHTKISTKGVTHLTSLSLDRLDLRGCAAIDSSVIIPLDTMDHLGEVDLTDTSVSPEALRALQEVRPGSRILPK